MADSPHLELVEVFVERCDEDTHPYWSGEPESIGFFTVEQINAGVDKEHGGEGRYSYAYND